MQTNNKVTTLCIIASAVLMACSNQKVVTPLVVSPSIAESTPTLISMPTYTATEISTSTPSMTPQMVGNSSEFCIGQIAPWSCSCGDLSNTLIQIKNSSQAGLCDVNVPNEDHQAGGYSVTLPNNWFCKVVGVASNNLRCFSSNNQEIFLQSLVTELPITQADEAISVFQEGEGHFSDPIVETDEEKNSRELVNIGDKQVLKLLTSQKDSYILRYFMKNGNSLYVLQFAMKDPDDQESKKTVIILEDAVRSIRFSE